MAANGYQRRQWVNRGCFHLKKQEWQHGKACSRGFTLLEVLVAVVVTGFGILGFAGLLKVIGDLEEEDTWATKATFCAQERMEEIRFSFMSGNEIAAGGEEILTDGPYIDMRRRWVTEASSVFNGIREVTVACAYPWKGSMKSFEVSTLLFREE